MPCYRLIADHGRTVDTFTAADDDAAETHARNLAEHAATASSTGYRLEIEDDGTWQSLLTWLPRWLASAPGKRNQNVLPPIT